jgi:hypothetical protein
MSKESRSISPSGYQRTLSIEISPKTLCLGVMVKTWDQWFDYFENYKGKAKMDPDYVLHLKLFNACHAHMVRLGFLYDELNVYWKQR